PNDNQPNNDQPGPSNEQRGARPAVSERAPRSALARAEASALRVGSLPASSKLLALGCAGLLALLVAGVTVEGPRRSELAQLVSDHVLGDEHGHELAAVVYREREADRFGEDRRPPRPRLDHLLRLSGRRFLDLLEQVAVDERPLLDTARHP